MLEKLRVEKSLLVEKSDQKMVLSLEKLRVEKSLLVEKSELKLVFLLYENKFRQLCLFFSASVPSLFG